MSERPDIDLQALFEHFVALAPKQWDAHWAACQSESEFPRRRTRKRGGRPRGSLGGHARLIREEVHGLLPDYDVMTVRQAFYALTVRGIVEKTEAGYRQVQRQILLMRREGILPWEFIADGTRWVHAPETWDDVDDVLQETARTYRRNLWRSQNVRLELWLEKDALASIVSEITYAYDVRLMVARGQSSDTYCHSAAQEARNAWEKANVETHVYTLFDSDKSGRIAAQKVAEKLATYSGGAPITVEALAVTDWQIETWNLPTRPAKEKGEPDAVELDAIEAARRNGRYRVGKRRRRPTSETMEIAALLKSRGLVVGAISEKLGVSEPYVRKCLSKSRTAEKGAANPHG